MKKNSALKIKKLLILLLTCVIGVSAVIVDSTECVFADEVETVSYGVKWRRAKSKSDLAKYCSEHWDSSLGKYISNTETGGINYELNDKDEKKTNWKRILIMYKDDGDWYYLTSGSIGTEDEIETSRITPAVNGIKLDADSFDTKSTLGTPYAKVTSSSGNGIYIRTAKGDNQVGDDCLAANINWYGVRWHACHEVTFLKANVTGTKSVDAQSKEFRTATCSNADPEIGITSSGDDFRLHWYSHRGGCSDRAWEYDEEEIEYDNDDGDKFRIYIGDVVINSVVAKDTTIGKYSSAALNNFKINEGVTLMVDEGATLVLSGETLNNGCIYVNGGTLVVNDSLDTSVITTTARTSTLASWINYCPGSIIVNNGGTLIVDKDAVLCARGPSSSILVYNSSMVYNEGTILVGSYFNLENRSMFRGLPGSYLVMGATFQGTLDYRYLTTTYLAANSGKYGDSLLAWNGSYSGHLNIGSNSVVLDSSSFISEGGAFINGSYSCSADSSVSAKITQNPYQTVGSMMKTTRKDTQKRSDSEWWLSDYKWEHYND